jgi:hypothetical protein
MTYAKSPLPVPAEASPPIVPPGSKMAAKLKLPALA